VKNVHNRDAERGRNAALTAAINQSTASGAKGAEARTSASRNTRLYEHELTSQKVQATKRQQLLREILVTNTDNLKSEGQQANKAQDPCDNPKPKPPLKKQTKQKGARCSSWVCNSLWAKQGQRGGAPEARCMRCRIPRYCSNQCKDLHWTKSHQKGCTPNVSWCPACGEDIESGASTNTACERCKEEDTAPRDASTMTSTTTCTDAL